MPPLLCFFIAALLLGMHMPAAIAEERGDQFPPDAAANAQPAELSSGSTGLRNPLGPDPRSTLSDASPTQVATTPIRSPSAAEPGVGAESESTAHDSQALPPPSENPLSLALPRADRPSRSTSSQDAIPSLVTVLGSLAVVLALFFLMAWLLRRAAPKGSALLSKDVVEVLGRAPLASRQFVHLLRIGNKLLLVCVTPGGAETLTEITDPIEVDRLAGLCTQSHPFSSTTAFRQVFQQLSGQSTSVDSIDSPGTGSPGAEHVEPSHA